MLMCECGRGQGKYIVEELRDGQPVTRLLCQACWEASRFFDEMEQYLAQSQEWLKAHLKQREDRCGLCGATRRELVESQRLGCAQCATTFEDIVAEWLRSAHGSMRYNGPRTLDLTSHKVKQLKAQLQQAITKEDYALAAKLRDQIAALEKEVRP